eukprot:TRINITY_DN33698_c0_g1_i1.p1 TRINITY_DN33698_c0_g1~~TRINITY_DN33698_c0_g1_i1.p1  ORF type:complete len:534 (+),score=113.10 TRINITY_DN33698_c0_g1_i1:38-1639(+)
MMGIALNAPDAEAVRPECTADEERQVEHLLRRSQRCSAHSRAFSSSSSSSTASDAVRVRQTALEELTRRFSSLDYRDEWLVAATWLVDRAAASPAAGAQQQDAAARACDVYKSKPLWLGAVLMMVKMLGADTELDCDPKEIMMPLMLDWPEDPHDESDGSRTRKERLQKCWNEMVKGEQRICNLLGFDLLVPTPLDLLQALAAVILKAGGEESPWSGFEKCEISVIRGSPGAKKPAKVLAMTRFEALAGLLVELGLMRRPAEVYGSDQSARLLAFAAIHLSLYGFFKELPDDSLALQAPKACTSAFARLQSRLLSEEEAKMLPSVCGMLHRLWEEAETNSCPVTQKWTRRSMGPGIKLPKPTSATAEDLSAHTEPLSQTPPRRHAPPATATPMRLTATRGKKLKPGSPVSKCSVGQKMTLPLAKSKEQASPPLQRVLITKQKSEALTQQRTELARSSLKRRRTDDEQEQLAAPRCPQQKKAKPADMLTRLAACQKIEHSHDKPPCAPLPVLSQGPSPMKPRHRKSPILPILRS